MAATTAAVIGAAAAVGGTVNAMNAGKRATRDVKNANIESARMLAEAGQRSEADILRASTEAIGTVASGAEQAAGHIQEFADTGVLAFDDIREQIISGLPVSGPIADSIRTASTDFARSRPELFDLSGPIQAEVARQGDLAVSGAAPAFRSNLLTAAQQGIAATSDIAGIDRRALERMGDIVSTGSAQRASALVGSTPQLAQLSTGAGEAQLLSDVAGQRARTDITETLAQLAGRIK